MPHPSPNILSVNTPRVAQFTSAANNEVQLSHVQDGGKEHGRMQHTFYSPMEYAQRRQAHGPFLYPNIQPHAEKLN